MIFDYKQLPHPGIRSLAPYIPGKSTESLAKEQGLSDIIKLASNENPLGCSPKALEALTQLVPHQLATYTVSAEHPFRTQLANHLNLDKEMVLLSNGSDTIFNLSLVCFALHSNRAIVTHDAAFIQYEIQAKTLGIPVIKTPLKKDKTVDIEQLINVCQTQSIAMLFLANPNNPTGILIPQKQIQDLLEGIPAEVIVVLDEAYYEYTPVNEQSNPSLLLQQFPNLILTRTFSKIYGLAALRLGYALANPVLIELLYRIQLPFIVNQAAMKAASAALEDQNFVQQTLENNHYGMKQVREGLQELQLKQLPSAGNFIAFDTGHEGLTIDQLLQQQGIIVRPLNPYGLSQYLRVTIGTKEQNTRFLTALSHSLKELS